MRRIEGIIYDPKDIYPQEFIGWQVRAFKKVFFQDVSPNAQPEAIENFRNDSRESGYKLIFPISRTRKS